MCVCMFLCLYNPRVWERGRRRSIETHKRLKRKKKKKKKKNDLKKKRNKRKGKGKGEGSEESARDGSRDSVIRWDRREPEADACSMQQPMMKRAVTSLL